MGWDSRGRCKYGGAGVTPEALHALPAGAAPRAGPQEPGLRSSRCCPRHWTLCARASSMSWQTWWRHASLPSTRPPDKGWGMEFTMPKMAARRRHAHILLAAQKHGKQIERAGGKGSWSRTQTCGSDWTQDPRGKGKSKDAKGKAKRQVERKRRQRQRMAELEQPGRKRQARCEEDRRCSLEDESVGTTRHPGTVANTTSAAGPAAGASIEGDSYTEVGLGLRWCGV